MGNSTTEPVEARPKGGEEFGDIQDPKSIDAMRSKFMIATWYKDPEKQKIRPWNFLYVLGNFLRYKGQNPHPGDAGNKLKVYPFLAQHVYIFPRAMLPILIQVISMKVFNIYWSLPVAMAFYALSMVFYAISLVKHINKLNSKYGFLDGKAKRDVLPDITYTHNAIALLAVVTIRPIMGCFMAYDPYELPHFTWMTPVHMIAYITILDFWYYWAHRASHEIDSIWYIHKTHHMTKHPGVLHSIFADTEQDMWDVLLAPLFTVLTYPMDFHTWWVTTVYILFVEAAGHSGARLYWVHPIVGPVYRWFNLELLVEDHDLHHRHGWKKSCNYGKQTRVWDTLFGTTRDRVETREDNIDQGKWGLGVWEPTLRIVGWEFSGDP